MIVAFVVTTWLLAIASGAKPGTDRANARLDAVRTGLAAGAGAGAAVGLMLAFRRQHHQEIATDLTDRDATERRITELYTKAVEQLGSDKAPVRLGGLYALERLAQDNPAQRQTIVNVICAYLRMPFALTAPSEYPDLKSADEPPGDIWQQERQVRLTAQRILAEHLRDDRSEDQRSTDPPSPRFWPDIRLDLAGATLIDFDLEDGVMADADFHEATFSGDAAFSRATFSGTVDFAMRPSAATPRSTGRPSAATSVHRGDLPTRRSAGDLQLPAYSAGRPSAASEFDGATFTARRFRATFSAGFAEATFSSAVLFGEATFSSGAAFNKATFNSRRSVEFGGPVQRLQRLPATFSNRPVQEATFSLLLSRRVTRPAPDAQHVWPTGWRLGPDGSGGYTVVRANDAPQPTPVDGSGGASRSLEGSLAVSPGDRSAGHRLRHLTCGATPVRCRRPGRRRSARPARPRSRRSAG